MDIATGGSCGNKALAATNGNQTAQTSPFRLVNQRANGSLYNALPPNVFG